MSPALSVPNLVDETPTIHGKIPPPMLDKTNMTEPTRDDDAPNS